MAAYRRVYDSHHLQAEWLTAKNRDQLRNHMLGNRVWLPLPFFIICSAAERDDLRLPTVRTVHKGKRSV